MSKQYKGSLSLEWFNKQKAILIQETTPTKSTSDVPAPIVNWINKDEALFYEIVDAEGRGLAPYWVDRSDIRVKEARPLVFQKAFIAQSKNKKGNLPGTAMEYNLVESDKDDPIIENILIKGDNLLALNSLKKIFDRKPDEEKIKCIYLDPPYSTGNAFKDYDDNLEQSEWLTLMRDRLEVLRALLKEKGLIFVQTDKIQQAYIKILLESIFGKENYIATIGVRMSGTSGYKIEHSDKTIVKNTEFINVFSKTPNFTISPQYEKSEYDNHYSMYLYNSNGRRCHTDLLSVLNKKLPKIFEKYGLKATIANLSPLFDYSEEFRKFVFTEKNNIARGHTAPAAILGNIRKYLELFKVDNEIIEYKTEDDLYLLKMSNKSIDQVIPIAEKIREVNDFNYNGEWISNIVGDWWAGFEKDMGNVQREGGVILTASKKPERLIQRIFKLATNKGDRVLDCFGGSGTSFAVAHKMGLKWIGVEMGKHADTLCIPRLKGVLSGEDQSGISESEKWKGGGSFKYYHLGASIINTSKEGKGDFNWQLGAEFIQDSLLSSYDYNKVEGVFPVQKIINKGSSAGPAIGIQKIGSKIRACVISLNEPKWKHDSMPDEEIKGIYKALKSKYSPHDITIFTNRGVDVSFDSKPEDLEIIKVPQAIFADLEK